MCLYTISIFFFLAIVRIINVTEYISNLDAYNFFDVYSFPSKGIGIPVYRARQIFNFVIYKITSMIE